LLVVPKKKQIRTSRLDLISIANGDEFDIVIHILRDYIVSFL